MNLQATLDGFASASATFDAHRRYRYALTRRWALVGTTACFVMLNPSTADEERLDPTIRKCVGFARRWGHAGILVLNLFALRSTNPQALWTSRDPIGDDNDATMMNVLAEVRPAIVVAAWGAWSFKGFDVRQRRFRATFPRPLHHLGLTKGGHPRHPLYLRWDAVPTLWS